MHGSWRDHEGWLRSRWLAITFITIATLASYSNSLHGPFILDDRNNIVENRSIRGLWPLRDVFVVQSAGKTFLHSRPLANLTLAVNYAMGGLETFPYHATNVAAHLLAGLTLFGVIRRTLLLPGLRERFDRAATPMALAVALLWLLHPIQTHAVTYVIQRYETMMGLFFLLAVYALIRSGTSSRPRAWAVAAVAAVLAAMGCKEVAVTAPLVLLLYDRTFLAGSFRAAWSRRRGLYTGLAGAWLLFALWQTFVGSRSAWSGYGLHVSWLEYARTQPGVILHYLRLSLWPYPLVLYYDWPVARSLGEILPGTAVVGGLAGVSVIALSCRPKWGFLGAWFFLILAPTSSVLPLADLAFIHRMYLPLAAVMVAVVLCWHAAGEAIERRGWLAGRGAATVRVGVATAVVVSMAAATRVRNRDFSSDLSIWTDNVQKVPRNAPAVYNLGVILSDLGRVDEAIAHYRRALEIDPNYAAAHNNLGVALVGRGQIGEAIAHYRRALEIDPNYAAAHNNLGIALAERGRIGEAIAHYRRALGIKPDYAKAHFNLGISLASLGLNAEAVAHYRQALEIEQNSAEAHHELGIILSVLGRKDEANAHLRQALNLAILQGKQALAEKLRRSLALYDAGQPTLQ